MLDPREGRRPLPPTVLQLSRAEETIVRKVVDKANSLTALRGEEVAETHCAMQKSLEQKYESLLAPKNKDTTELLPSEMGAWGIHGPWDIRIDNHL